MIETPEKAPPDEPQASRFEREALPHLSRLYLAALRMTDDPADAGALVRETFARAYRDYPHQRPDTRRDADRGGRSPITAHGDRPHLSLSAEGVLQFLLVHL